MMRCRFCGSTSIHSAIDHKNFSAGKALAGTVVFGPMGAGAGMLGKEIKGFRCTQCGSFMEHPMDPQTEQLVNDAIYSAKNRKSYVSYDFYKNQYPNIENIQKDDAVKDKQVSIHVIEKTDSVKAAAIETNQIKIKRSYRTNVWDPSCPVYIRNTIIKTSDVEDGISFDIVNQSGKTIRSLYLQAAILDDAGDSITTIQCVYQGENVEPGDRFLADKVFSIGSDLAYKAEVICEKVSFTDDTVWRAQDATKAYEIELSEIDHFPRFRYLYNEYNRILIDRGVVKKNRRGTIDASQKQRPRYLPVQNENNNYWTCTCGMPVKMNEPCPVCKCRLEELQMIFSQEYLQKLQHDAVLERAAERAKETSEFRENLIKKEEEKKAEQYEKALSAESSDSISALTDAVKILVQLGDYKEAESKRAEYSSRIDALKAEEERKQKELEEKRKEEQNKRLQEEEKTRKKRTKLLILVVVALIAILAYSFISKHNDPYQIVHRYIIKNGKQESDAQRITIKDDDILFGEYTAYLTASDYDNKPFWLEISYHDVAGKKCKGEVEFRPSYVSFDVETDYRNMPVKNESGRHVNFSGEATVFGSVDVSHLKDDDWYRYLQINGISEKDRYAVYDYDGLKGTTPEGEPEIQNTLAEAAFLSIRSLEKALEENDMKVTMDDLGLISLSQSNDSPSLKKGAEDTSVTDQEGTQQNVSAYEICKENILSTGSRRSDDFFDGYVYVLPVEPGTTDYFEGSVAAEEKSDNLFVLFEFNGTASDVTGMRWKLELDGKQGRYELRQSYKVEGKKEFATLKGTFDLATYSPDSTYTADEVILEEDSALDVSSVQAMKTAPTSFIISSVSSLYYWLDKSEMNISIEDLGFAQ